MFVLLDPNSTERRVIPGGSFVSAYNRQVKLYFNAGEQVQAQVFTRGSAGTRLVNIYLQGSLITP